MKKIILILMILLMTSFCWAEESEPPTDEPYEEALAAVFLASNDPNCINYCAIDKQMCIASCDWNNNNCRNRCSQSFGRCVSRCN